MKKGKKRVSLDAHVLNYSRSFVELLGGPDGLNRDDVIELRLNRAIKDIGFLEVMEGLVQRGINVFELAYLLYCTPAIIEDMTKKSPQKNAEKFLDGAIKDYRADAKKHGDIKNFLKKNRTTFKKTLTPETDALIKKSVMLETAFREMADRLSERKKFIKNQLGWQHAPGVDVKKQTFWTRATIEALDFLARYKGPHEGKTEEKDLRVIAFFLRALYPRMWSGDVKKIQNRLRKKVYDFRYR